MAAHHKSTALVTSWLQAPLLIRRAGNDDDVNNVKVVEGSGRLGGYESKIKGLHTISLVEAGIAPQLRCAGRVQLEINKTRMGVIRTVLRICVAENSGQVGG